MADNDSRISLTESTDNMSITLTNSSSTSSLTSFSTRPHPEGNHVIGHTKLSSSFKIAKPIDKRTGIKKTHRNDKKEKEKRKDKTSKHKEKEKKDEEVETKERGEKESYDLRSQYEEEQPKLHDKITSTKPLVWSLKKYQDEVVKWMEKRENTPINGVAGGILALDMGLGKTLITLSRIAEDAKQNHITYRDLEDLGHWTLVVCSKNLVSEWIAQIEKFFGEDVYIWVLHADWHNKKYGSRPRYMRDVKFGVMITTYDVCSGCFNFAFPEETKKKKKTKISSSSSPSKESYFHLTPEESCYFQIRSKTPDLLRKALDEPKKKITKSYAFKSEATGFLFHTHWRRVILDESQKIANYRSITFKAVSHLQASYKWCLTGTPFRNFSTDIWSQLKFCGFDRGQKKPVNWDINRFRMSGMNFCVYSLDYKQAGVELPSKIKKYTEVYLTYEEKRMYETIRTVMLSRYSSLKTEKEKASELLKMFTLLRQAVIDPKLIIKQSKFSSYVTPEIKEFFEFANRGDYISSKMKSALEIIREHAPHEKLIVFSNFLAALQELQNYVTSELGIKTCILNGKNTGPERDEIKNTFKTDESCRVLFMTYKIGAEGLNLTEARCCVMLEPWWTNSVHSQAEGRMWRIGQTKDVHIFNLICQGTIEEKILALCHKKDKISEDYKKASSNKAITTKDIFQILDLTPPTMNSTHLKHSKEPLVSKKTNIPSMIHLLGFKDEDSTSTSSSVRPSTISHSLSSHKHVHRRRSSSTSTLGTSKTQHFKNLRLEKGEDGVIRIKGSYENKHTDDGSVVKHVDKGLPIFIEKKWEQKKNNKTGKIVLI